MTPEIRVRPRRGRWLRRQLRRLAVLLRWVGLFALLWLCLPAPFGARLGVTVVSGDSMEPTYHSGDAVLTWRRDDYAVGQPIVYAVPDGQTGAGVHVVHRIVRSTADGYRTQGDNKAGPDPWLPGASEVQGAVFLHVPHGGFLLRWLLSPLVLAATCGVLTALAVIGHLGGTGPPTTPTSRRRRRGHRAASPPRGLIRAAIAVALTLGWLIASPAHAASLTGLASTEVYAASVTSQLSANPVVYEHTLTSDNPTSYCATVLVTNTSDQSVTWQITLNIAQPPFNAVDLASSYSVTTVSFEPSVWTVRGVDFNQTLGPGESTLWGYCGTRAEPPLTSVDVAVTVTSSGAGAYCVDVIASTTSPNWVRWQAVVGHDTPGVSAPAYWLDEEPTNAWGLSTLDFVAGAWTLSGDGTNDYVRAGTPATGGYCAVLSGSAPPVEADVAVTITSSGGGSYCAAVSVTTTSVDWVRWQATISPGTTGLANASYWLDAEPTNFWSATSASFSAATQTWVVTGTGSNDYVRAGSGTTWGYCAPTSASAPPVEGTVVAVVSNSGAWGYCADVTVSTTSTEPVRWQATIGHGTSGLTAPAFWLTTQPTNYWNATPQSFTSATGTWVLQGAGFNDLIQAGQPATFGFCASS